ncbi:hypothetical protein SAMN04488075_0212 [Paracoccus alkenifer]|uniref:Uncharacterized protein n=1 Tax=Paracoccus alkenifer TaxID=65735 RepID=A0A1H6JHM7_9RHOB|nr:hypothetical protein SAMN04488075_0212 [Paracoccus alkenifer]
MKDIFFLRTCVVLAAVILAGGAALCLLLQAAFGDRPELGQLLGLVAAEPGSPLETAGPELAWLPAWLCPVLTRLLRVEAWVYTALLLLALPVVLSLGIDWAAGRRKPSAGAEGPLPDQVPRMGRREAVDRLPPE